LVSASIAVHVGEADELGYFPANAVGIPLSAIMGITYGTERFGP
jgi:hypothetical protein